MSYFVEGRKKAKDFIDLLLTGSDSSKFNKFKFEVISKVPKDQQGLYNNYFNGINDIKEMIKKDNEFFYSIDPSAQDQTLVKYFASTFAVFVYRFAATFPDRNFARILMEYAKSVTGIDIHPDAKIGVPFAIDHGVGIVIGQTAVIGHHCVLYHGVTLGAKHLKDREQVGVNRHPKIGNYVTIYANTVVLGNVNIPDHLIIGANKFISSQTEIDELAKKQRGSE
jgi:serine O-acetyltransferase